MTLLRRLRVLVLLASLAAATAMSVPSAVANQDTRPNILFVLTDDLDVEYPDMTWLSHYPRLKELMADNGTTFRNAFVSLSLCCPSRTTILRGQFAHNTGIYRLAPPEGGFEDVNGTGLEKSTIATWLQASGYRTVMLGKYLNGYPSAALGPTYVPPGWDEWYAGLGDAAYKQVNYDLNENGKVVHYGNTAADYLQDVLRDRALGFLNRTAASGARRPFFMYFAAYSPHQPARPANRHAKLFSDLQAPRPPSFNEADISDKPAWLRGFPRLAATDINNIDALYRNRLRSTVGVVETLDTLIAALAKSGELNNTYIIFTSDNGFRLGEHRMLPGKSTAFDDDMRVPLIVRGPGVAKGVERQEMTLNTDFAPTFAELAHIDPPIAVDGRSLLPLLTAAASEKIAWRDAVLLERGHATGDIVSAGKAKKAPVVQANTRREPGPLRGLHTARYLYVEYQLTGEQELYDLAKDPYELINIAAAAPAGLLPYLSNRLAALKTCAGASCRTADAP